VPVPRKRELAAYRLLLEAGRVDLGEAIDIISSRLCTTRRTARAIVKRLRRIGAVSTRVEDGRILVEPVAPLEFLDKIVRGYIESRGSRCGDGEGRTRRPR